MLKRLAALAAASLLLAFVLAACGSDDPPAAPGPTGDDAAATPTATAPATTDDDAFDDSDDDLADFEPFEFAEGESIFDLAGVDSFRQRWSLTYSGPGAGDMSGSTEILTEFVRDPPAARIRATEPGGATTFEMIRIGQDAWLGGGGMSWQQLPAGASAFDPSALTMSGAFLMPGTPDEMGLVTRSSSEQLHGRQTTRYTLDGEALFQLMRQDPDLADAELTEGRVDYWVDESGRFLVKYEMVFEGTGLDLGFDDLDDFDDMPSSDGPVRMEMVFELYDFDADITIEPPE